MHYGDITDSLSVTRLINEIKPNEIYNLAAQSHVQVSFESPEYTANADALGALRILEAIRFNKLEKGLKFYQAGTSELYGLNEKVPQNEKALFHPASPYGSLNFTHIGLLSIIEKHIICLPAMEFYLITKAQEEEKHLSLKKLYKHYVKLN